MSANSHFPHPSYERPSCPKCGATMILSRFDRENPDDCKRTFDCIPCDHYETVILQYRQAASVGRLFFGVSRRRDVA
jgi:hypothetical protein